MIKISYMLRDNGGCGILRLDNPMQALKRNGIADVMMIEKGDNSDKILDSFAADIIVIPRVCESQIIRGMKQLQNGGKKIVLDFDDDMFNIHPLNAAYKDWGTESVAYKMPDGKVLDIWVDGVNMDIKLNKERMDGFKKACESADMIITTTPILAEVYRKYNRNVIALPNCLDMTLWQKLPLKPRDKEIRLFWTGGDSHYGDWYLLKDVLPVIMDAYPQVKLVILGTRFEASIKDLPQDRIEHHGWVHTRAYPFKTAILDADIAVIPLEDNHFNRCKSNVKWVEMSALEIPCVTSNVSPYKEYATEDNGIFVDNTPDAWIKGISMLIEDRLLRAKISGAAIKTAHENFDINTQYHRWHNTFENLLEGGDYAKGN